MRYLGSLRHARVDPCVKTALEKDRNLEMGVVWKIEIQKKAIEGNTIE